MSLIDVLERVALWRMERLTRAAEWWRRVRQWARSKRR